MERGSCPKGIRRSVVMHGLVNFVVCELTGIHTHVALGATTGGCYRGQGTALDAEVVCVWEGPREQIGIVSIKLALARVGPARKHCRLSTPTRHRRSPNGRQVRQHRPGFRHTLGQEQGKGGQRSHELGGPALTRVSAPCRRAGFQSRMTAQSLRRGHTLRQGRACGSWLWSQVGPELAHRPSCQIWLWYSCPPVCVPTGARLQGSVLPSRAGLQGPGGCLVVGAWSDPGSCAGPCRYRVWGWHSRSFVCVPGAQGCGGDLCGSVARAVGAGCRGHGSAVPVAVGR